MDEMGLIEISASGREAGSVNRETAVLHVSQSELKSLQPRKSFGGQTDGLLKSADEVFVTEARRLRQFDDGGRRSGQRKAKHRRLDRRIESHSLRKALLEEFFQDVETSSQHRAFEEAFAKLRPFGCPELVDFNQLPGQFIGGSKEEGGEAAGFEMRAHHRGMRQDVDERRTRQEPADPSAPDRLPPARIRRIESMAGGVLELDHEIGAAVGEHAFPGVVKSSTGEQPQPIDEQAHGSRGISAVEGHGGSAAESGVPAGEAALVFGE